MTAMAPRAAGGPRPNRGATLIIGMILLLFMSVVGLTALKAIRTDERISANLQDKYLAFQAAEAALREAENELSQPNLPAFYRFDQEGIPGPYEFTSENAHEYTRDLIGTAHVAQQPLYILEQMEGGVEQGSSLVIGVKYGREWRAAYRITAIGFGGSATTRVVLQTTYRR
jgi:type IV pilus assembly protein PilX